MPQLEAGEFLLSLEPYRAVVSQYGASLRRLWIETNSGPREFLWGYSGTAQKKGGQGDVLIPFPGRIAAGMYSFEGQIFQLEQNDKEGPNAIHGFVRARNWSEHHREDRITFTTVLSEEEGASRGYPFALTVEVEYALGAAGLSCQFRIRNDSARTAPVGAGFHPYFTVGLPGVDEALLELPARKYIEFSGNLLPTGRVLPTAGSALDFEKSRPLGPLKLNHCFTDFPRDSLGHANFRLRHPTEVFAVELWMDASFPYLVAYTGDALGPLARKALALEPMTCATDSFNRPEWGLIKLAPGATASGSWGVRVVPKTSPSK